jgi:hypothetical protein
MTICRSSCVSFVLLLLASFLLAAPSRGEYPATALPGWHPREVYADADVPPAQVPFIEKNLAAVEALVAGTAGYAAPHGFEVTPRWSYSAGSAPDQLTTYWLSIHVHVPTKEMAAGGYVQTVQIIFNPRLEDFTDSGTLHSEDGQIYRNEFPRAEPILGATVVWGSFGQINTPPLQALFTADGELPMLPISREQYLTAMIFELTEGGMSAFGDTLKPQIAAMSPEERASPALTQATNLVPAGTPDAHAIATANPTFYRAKQSAVEPRAILVKVPNAPGPIGAAHAQLYSEFDWAALKRLLDGRP